MQLKSYLIFAFLVVTILATACVPLAAKKATVTSTLAPNVTIAITREPSATPVPDSSPLFVTSLTPEPISTRIPAHGALVALHMFDTQNGWAVNDLGKVLITRGGLNAWEDVTPSNAPKPSVPTLQAYIPETFFLDAHHAWLVYIISESIVLYTSDGGTTWLTNQPLPESSVGAPDSLYFIDAKNGWMWSDLAIGRYDTFSDVLATTDGGATWQLRYSTFEVVSRGQSAMIGSYLFPFGTRVFSFLSSETGWAGTGNLYTTNDGGVTWNMVADNSGVIAGQIKWNLPRAIPFANDPYWYFTPPVFTSDIDGVLPVFLFEANNASFPVDEMYDWVPLASFLAWTHDGGQSWDFQSAPALIGSVSLYDKIGWFLGKDNPDSNVPASLFKTIDGGVTWTVLQARSFLPLGSIVQFVDEQNGFASPPDVLGVNYLARFDTAQTRDYLFVTSDGGSTWLQK